MSKTDLFEKCKVWWWNGFYILVRNSMNFKLEKMHVTENQKQLYEEDFGNQIILDTQFEDWLVKNARFTRF